MRQEGVQRGFQPRQDISAATSMADGQHGRIRARRPVSGLNPVSRSPNKAGWSRGIHASGSVRSMDMPAPFQDGHLGLGGGGQGTISRRCSLV